MLVPDLRWTWDWPEAWGRDRPRHVRAVNGVHVLASGGELLHTHEPEPMRALLAALDEPPDLVVADHGWAGAAAEAGIDTLGMADCNDPALFVAEEEGKPIVTVPLDDNVPPQLYDPLSAYVTPGDGRGRLCGTGEPAPLPFGAARACPMPPVGKPAARRVPNGGGVGMSSLSEMKFLTVAEVAAVMRVSKMTVYRLVHSGELASVRVGRSFRVPERAVHAYLGAGFPEVG